MTPSYLQIIVPTPTLVGMEEIDIQMGFLVQRILADRYIHCRELSVVSLKSTHILEYGIKKIVLNFVFTESCRG